MYASMFGLSDLPDWVSGPLAKVEDLQTWRIFAGSAIIVAFAMIPTLIGVFALWRKVWAVIVGTLLWVAFYFPGPLFIFPGHRSSWDRSR